MGGFDLTDIGGNSQGQNSGMFSSSVEVKPAQPQPAVAKTDIEATLQKPIIDPKKQALADEQGVDTRDLWNPVSEARPGGQFQAGEVDAAQEKLLANTEFDTSPVKDHVFTNRRIK